MSQNLKILFQNKLILSSFQNNIENSKNYKSISSKKKEIVNIDFLNQQSSYSNEQSINKNNIDLNYSMQTGQLTFVTHQVENGQVLLSRNDSDLHSLLTYEPETQQKLKDELQLHIPAEDENDNCEQIENLKEKFDYSQELYSLKNKIVQIQSIAQIQIIRLKQQLERQKQLRQKLQKRIKVEFKEASVNTDRDFRDDEIQTLKNSTLQLIDLNRQLLKKEITKSKADDMQTVMGHVKI